MKKEITEHIKTEYDYEFSEMFNGDLDQVREKVEKFLNELELLTIDKGHKKTILRIDSGYDGFSLEIYGVRDETDQEYQKRIEKNEKQRKKQKKTLMDKKKELEKRLKDLETKISNEDLNE